MKNIVVLCFVLAVFLPNVSCETFETRIAGRGLRLMTYEANWFNALYACRRIGMELPMIQSPEEDAELRTFMRRNSLHSLWLGATDIATEGTWIWTETGSLVGYTNWAIRTGTNPDNWKGEEHCLETILVGTSDDETWNDKRCGLLERFICMERLSKTERDHETTTDSKELQELKAGISQFTGLINALQKMVDVADKDAVDTKCTP